MKVEIYCDMRALVSLEPRNPLSIFLAERTYLLLGLVSISRQAHPFLHGVEVVDAPKTLGPKEAPGYDGFQHLRQRGLKETCTSDLCVTLLISIQN
jgi:hypothetical protein